MNVRNELHAKPAETPLFAAAEDFNEPKKGGRT
jgi:hypothetical protein